MNNKFYNEKITLIVSEELDYSFPPHVDLYVGTIEECYTKIKRYELDNDGPPMTGRARIASSNQVK